jgi:hypothetical protein
MFGPAAEAGRAKIGVSSRAAAALYTMEHNLLGR